MIDTEMNRDNLAGNRLFTRDMANILIHPANQTALREMAILGRAIEATGRLHCIFLVEDGGVAHMARDLELSDLGCEVCVADAYGRVYGSEGSERDESSDSLDGTTQRNEHKPGFAAMHTRFGVSVLAQLVAGLLKRYRQRKNIYDFLRTHNPALIVLGNNRHYGLELPLVDAARRADLPALIVPYGYSGQADLAVTRSRNSLYWCGSAPYRMLKWLLRLLRPDNLFEINGKNLFYYDPVEMLGLLLSRMLPRRPWVLGASGITKIAVSGSEDKDRLIERGIGSSRVVVTGMASHDLLYDGASNRRATRDRLVLEYDLNPDRQIIIWAVHQMAEDGNLDWESHWREVEAIAELLGELDAEILASLHPKADVAAYMEHLAPKDLKVMHNELSRNLPGADVFVAGYSTTVHWAILLGIPVFVMDFFGTGYDMYEHAGGASTVTNKLELRTSLQKCLVEVPQEQSGERAKTNRSSSVGVLDGQAVARLQGLVEHLAIGK